MREFFMSFKQNQQTQSFRMAKPQFRYLTMICDLTVMMQSIQKDIMQLINLQLESKGLQVQFIVQSSKDYYESNMHAPCPAYIPVQPFQSMLTRNRKKIKLWAQRQQSVMKKLQQIKEHNVQEYSKENILHHLSLENLSDLENLQENSSEVKLKTYLQSYDSEVHDIFNDFTLESKVRMAYSVNGEQENILDVKSLKQSNLIIDFKIQRNNANKNSHNEQDNHIGMSNKYSQPIGIEKSPYLSIASPNKKQEKKNSFIGYYNSLQKKEPSKILQKYLKQKK